MAVSTPSNHGVDVRRPAPAPLHHRSVNAFSPSEPGSTPRVSTPARSRSPGTSNTKASPPPRSPPSGASSPLRAWSPRNRRNDPAAPTSASKPTNPTRPGNQDFTHWALADGTDVEILNWLDDHSRLLLSCTAHDHVTGTDVVDTFTQNTNEYGLPASTLTDNGRVYTAKFGGGRNAFEYLIAALGIAQKNGHPYHPQTQGKIERFHQTLKRWLAARPRPRSPNCKASSTNSGSSTTSSDPTALSPGRHPNRPTTRPSKPPRLATRSRPTTGSVTTSSTNSANSPSATPANSTTSESAATTHENRSSSHRRNQRHHHRPQHRRDPRQLPHRTQQKLLAEPNKRARPMAGPLLNINDVPSHLPTMSRLITCVRPEGFEPPAY
jgi:hypothetical protein